MEHLGRVTTIRSAPHARAKGSCSSSSKDFPWSSVRAAPVMARSAQGITILFAHLVTELAVSRSREHGGSSPNRRLQLSPRAAPPVAACELRYEGAAALVGSVTRRAIGLRPARPAPLPGATETRFVRATGKHEGRSVRRIRTEIEIDAPPADVWRVLTSFSEFAEWNPFMPDAQGEASAGSKLHVRMSPPGGSAMTIHPTVLVADEPREFRWLGHMGIPGLFDGEHVFELEDLGGRTRFVQREKFRGIFAAPILAMVGEKTERGFVEMNEALRARVESG